MSWKTPTISISTTKMLQKSCLLLNKSGVLLPQVVKRVRALRLLSPGSFPAPYCFRFSTQQQHPFELIQQSFEVNEIECLKHAHAAWPYVKDYILHLLSSRTVCFEFIVDVLRYWIFNIEPAKLAVQFGFAKYYTVFIYVFADTFWTDT